MGCSSSKDNVNIIPVKSSSQAWTEERNAENINKNNAKLVSADKRKSKSDKLVRTKSKDDLKTLPSEDALIKTDRSTSQHSLRSENDGINRGVSSATSKVSTHTFDSGLEEDFLPNMITENSHPDQQMIADDRPATPDLGVVGTQMQSRKSSSKSGRQASNDILQGLRSDGLLAAFGKKQGGMSFDVMIAPEFGILKKPPARLAKLKTKRSSKEFTKEEWEAKMQRTEERRQRKEAKMIAKLNTAAKELKVHKLANINAKTQQEQAEVNLTKTLDKVAANREAHLKAIQDKMQLKERHAEKVRLAKLERLAENKPAQEDEDASSVV